MRDVLVDVSPIEIESFHKTPHYKSDFSDNLNEKEKSKCRDIPDESTCLLKGIINDAIYEQFCNKHASQVEEHKESVVVYKEYIRDHRLPELMEELRPVPSKVQWKKATPETPMSRDSNMQAYIKYLISAW
ncbi:hypothetical protein PVK06_012311 [Gossypium arboreum]|uniref:Uncharacterized protein n=1 Tax=Gossypium arboreum TaxID=29729 RepID=A0ABR0QBE4_GOSAR|nr:hypothetical protein PVK06_012311 [Gossypium arboreum]